jgi:hypothetical protein
MGKNYHVVRSGNDWAVKREGADKAGSLHPTQKDAIDVARDRAIRDRGEVVIHDRHGQIRDKDSYGNDPCPPKDTKH